MTSHKPSRIHTAPSVTPVPVAPQRYATDIQRKATAKAQRQANATLDAAAPLRYTHSMGKRLRASEWSDSMKKAAHAALVEWNKP